MKISMLKHSSYSSMDFLGPRSASCNRNVWFGEDHGSARDGTWWGWAVVLPSGCLCRAHLSPFFKEILRVLSHSSEGHDRDVCIAIGFPPVFLRVVWVHAARLQVGNFYPTSEASRPAGLVLDMYFSEVTEVHIQAIAIICNQFTIDFNGW